MHVCLFVCVFYCVCVFLFASAMCMYYLCCCNAYVGCVCVRSFSLLLQCVCTILAAAMSM